MMTITPFQTTVHFTEMNFLSPNKHFQYSKGKTTKLLFRKKKRIK